MWIEELCNHGPDNCTFPLIPPARRAQRTAAFCRSTLAIAALSTTDSLFASRDPTDVVATIVNLPIGPDRTTVPHVFKLERSWSWVLTLQKEPLLRSPQFVVDRLLAPRMLLFGSKQVFWECGAACACELHPDARSTAMAARAGGRGFDESKRLFKPTLDMSFYRKSEVVWRQILLDWYRVVEVYNAKDFGLAGDDNTGIPNGKLRGLTDIAVQVEAAVTREGFSSLGCYIAGHWKGTLPGSLCWTAKRPGHRFVSTSMPSWSWASLDAPVTFHVSAEESSQVALLPKLVSVSAGGSAGSDDGGSGTITLQGRLARALLLPSETQDEEQIRVVGEGFRMVASLEGEHKTVHNRTRTAVWGAVFDTKEDICDEFSVLPMTIRPNAPYRSVSCLALAPVSGSGTNDGVYRRIGIVTIEGPKTHLSEADYSELEAFLNELIERELYLQ
ncbi:hypothetical protein F5Y08DRAFT_288135 [Xylaria arbuscula]|nr:hypothetical protein F5Y08DRAFT_288135 [Xylaria arbuscula]